MTRTPGHDQPRTGDDEATDSARLLDLLSISDPALNGLNGRELTSEMLERVRMILSADTATVLLMDEGGESLTAKASRGLEEEIWQGVRVPVGSGFAGTIAAHRQPVMINQVGPETVTNPILWGRHLRAMLGAPMMRDDQVIGVLHVGRMAQEPFTEEDAELLLVAADRVAGAVTEQELSAETAAADLLERSLLPGRLPRVPGAELAGRFVAAERMIGGDWYDAFVLPGGELWLVVGDVAGHGLRSAVVMGRVRSTLRAYALLGGGPARVLELTDRKVQHFEMGLMTTILCAVAKPPYDCFEISSAGHLPPVLAAPGAEPELLEVDTNPPLGSLADVQRTVTTVDIPLGGVLALYTDGLVERPGAPIDDGMARLRESVRADHPEMVCRSVMMRMIGREVPRDDVTLLTMRHTAIH